MTCLLKILRLVLSLALYLVFGAQTAAMPAGADTASGEPAKVSPRSLAQLLLLDIAVAGKRLVAVGERGYIIISDDPNRGWQRAENPGSATLTALYFVDANNGWAIGHDATIAHSSDGGVSWREQHVDVKAQGPLLDVWFRDAQDGYAVGAYGTFLKTRDGGATWQPRRVGEEERHINAIAGDRKGRLYIAGEAGLMYASDDSGEHWHALAVPYRGSFFGIVPFADDGLLVFGLRGEIFRSTDGGASWHAARSEQRATLMGGAVTADGRIVLVGMGGALIVSVDQGASFMPLTGVTDKAYASVLPLDAEHALVVGEGGVRRVSLSVQR